MGSDRSMTSAHAPLCWHMYALNMGVKINRLNKSKKKKRKSKISPVIDLISEGGY